MKAISSSKELDYRWAPVTAISGVAGLISYFGVLAAEHSNNYAVLLAFGFAFGIAVSSIGIYHVLGGATGSRLGLIATVANVTATGLLIAMIMVQMAVLSVVHHADASIQGVWWGLDVAWDLYLSAGTILFGLAMIGRRGLGAWLGVPGVLISVLLLSFNVATFPQPPESAGLVDFGPLVGLWYLVVYVRLGSAAILLKRQRRQSTALLSS